MGVTKLGKVRISFFGALAKITKEKTVNVESSTLKEVLDVLIVKYGEQFKDRIYDEKGNLRRFVNIYVNGKDIRFINHLHTELNAEDTVSIVPAVGGGSRKIVKGFKLDHVSTCRFNHRIKRKTC
ncbi:MAG: ubiquitin-like small modifier protein 1 [Candidatus Bathyarchaeia archaeon]